MSDNAVNKSINIPLDVEEDNNTGRSNSFSDAIEALGKIALETYEDKTSNLTSENILGQIRCEVLNDWKLTTYGYEHSSLKLICKRMPQKSMSRNGFGLLKLIEMVKGIQASFEQNDGIRAIRDAALNQRRL